VSTGTTLVAVKQALRTALRARIGLTGVIVSYTQPAAFESDDNIWFGTAIASTELSNMRGGAPLTVMETVELELHIQSGTFVDDGQETADLRATALLAEVQQELASTPQTTADVMITELIGWEHSTGPAGGDGSGYASHFTCRVRIRARLS
jgi:hypothetical protein